MTLRAHCRKLAVTLVAGLVLLTSACQGPGVPSPSGVATTSPAPAEPTSPPPGGGDFFTWEQAKPLHGAAAAVARTLHARTYFVYLAARYDGYIHPHWPQISNPDLDPTTLGTGGPVMSRGPVTERLMRVTITGNIAVTETCEDNRQVDYAPNGTDDWKDASSPIAGSSTTLIRSAESPTGWVITTDLEGAQNRWTENDCRRAFDHKEPALTDMGEPDYLDRWPNPNSTPLPD